MKRAMLLAATACVAMFALPAVASAGTWHVQNGTIGFSGTGGEGKLTPAGGTTVDCSSITVKGAYETTTTGWIKITYHGCFATTIFNPHCQSAEQPTGTITTEKLTFHNVLTAGGTAGILLTPNHTTGRFASFSCFGIATTVAGNGLIGTVERNCGGLEDVMPVNFASNGAGHPQHTQITGTGTHYILESSTSGSTRFASMDTTWTVTFEGGVKQTINCTL